MNDEYWYTCCYCGIDLDEVDNGHLCNDGYMCYYCATDDVWCDRCEKPDNACECCDECGDEESDNKECWECCYINDKDW